MQGVKKESKSLEDLCEKLDSIQETWQFQGTGGDVLAGDVSGVGSHFTRLVFTIIFSGAVWQTGPVPRWCESKMSEKGQLSHKDSTGTVMAMFLLGMIQTWIRSNAAEFCFGTKYFTSCCFYVLAVAAADHEHFKSGRGDSGDSHRRGAASVETQAADGLHWKSSWHQSGPSPEVVRTWQCCRGVSCRGASFVCGRNLLLMLFVQVHGCHRSATRSAWAAAETARPEQEIQLHRCLRPRWPHGRNWEFCHVLVHKTSFKVRHFKLYSTWKQIDTSILMRHFVVCLQCSHRREATCHDGLATATSDAEDHGAIRSVSKVWLHSVTFHVISAKQKCEASALL